MACFARADLHIQAIGLRAHRAAQIRRDGTAKTERESVLLRRVLLYSLCAYVGRAREARSYAMCYYVACVCIACVCS